MRLINEFMASAGMTVDEALSKGDFNLFFKVQSLMSGQSLRSISGHELHNLTAAKPHQTLNHSSMISSTPTYYLSGQGHFVVAATKSHDSLATVARGGAS